MFLFLFKNPLNEYCGEKKRKKKNEKKERKKHGNDILLSLRM
jgi:hypothetical protein